MDYLGRENVETETLLPSQALSTQASSSPFPIRDCFKLVQVLKRIGQSEDQVYCVHAHALMGFLLQPSIMLLVWWGRSALLIPTKYACTCWSLL